MQSKTEQTLKKRNAKLKKELAAKNREIEIEAALEIVRGRSMAMQKSEELKEVIQLVYEQFVLLNIHIEHTGFLIDYKVRDDMHIWLADQHLAPSEVTIPYFDSPPNNSIKEAKEKGRNFFNYNLAFEEKNKFYSDLFKYIPGVPEETLKYYLNCPGLAGSGVFLDNIGLYIENFSGTPYTDVENNVLMRFGKVFQQTYTRFLDLQKAEAQAREAKIEAALERVRSSSLAMHSSEELQMVINEIFVRLTELNIVADSANILIFQAHSKDIECWTASPTSKNNRVIFPYVDYDLQNDLINNNRAGTEIFTSIYTKEQKDAFFAYHFEKSELRSLSRERKEFILNAESYNVCVANCKAIAININRYSDLAFSTSDKNILYRFAKVFYQCYTRFLDLQKAEAQARESQIQLALERVRARTMAMQKSDELSETVYVLFQQFKELGENPDQATIGVMNEDEKLIEYWVTMYGKPINKVFKFSIDEPNVTNKIYKAWKENKKSLMIDLSGNALTEFMAYRAEKGGAAINPDEKRRIINVAFFSRGLLNVQSDEERSEESIKLLERFASVFEQTYTRFLDLQNAEAQAKESQIQLALERVRARAMAMQQSEELAETASVLFQQMNTLGNTPERLNIGVINEEKGFIETWATEQGGNQINHGFNARLDEPTTIAKMYEGWKAKKTSMIVDISGKELKQWIHFLQDELKMPVNEEILQNRRVQSVAYFKEGFILMTTPEPLPAETISLLERFADVFNLTYTRFLDLQKAEAQAKEAQIEASLERVRSHTIAMHKSADLLEVISVLSEQFLLLGFKIHSANFNTSYREKDWNLWLYNPGTPMFPDQIHIPYLDNPFFNRTLESITNGADFTAFVFTKEEKDGFLDHLYSTTIALNTSEERKRFAYNAPGFAWSTVYLKNTALTIANYDAEPYTGEQNAILRRFGNAFEQTYTRFLDLQKAEAQAREAIIEAGLERVRSRAMAMQSSEELAPLIGTVLTELTKLDLTLTRCVIWIFDTETNGATWWMANSEDAQNPISCDLPYNAYEPYLVFLEQWEKRTNKFQYELSGTIKKDWDDYLFNKTGLAHLPAVVIDGMKAPECVFLTASFNNFGAMNAATLEPLSDQDIDILLRFAKVFDLTYTRFNDLKQAEAQAREAEIQLALERVRAKAMAMHNSNDVSVAASMVFSELRKLGINPIRCGVGLLNKESRKAQLYSATSSDDADSLSLVGWVMLKGHPVLESIYEAWLKKEDYYPELTGAQLKSYYENLLAGLSLPIVPNSETGEKQYGHIFSFSVGCLYTWSDRHYNDSEIRILKRFAGIIDLTFRRYLDLQKAEANAKEAKIEASLERVRGKAMSMHSSRDLADTIEVFYHEVESLSITPRRCGVGLMDKETHFVELSTMNTTELGESIEIIGKLKLEGHPVLEGIYDNWVLQKEYHPVLRGDEIKQYYQLIRPQIAYPDYPTDMTQYGYFFFFNEGGVYAWTEKELSEDELKIYRRFTSVLSLTYKRYKDLKDAEANTKEAIKQASLDRVRAETASMRTTRDLEKITPLIWNELTTLRVPFIRCGVFIMDEQQKQIHSFLSTPDGKAIAAFQLPYHSAGELSKVLAHWHKNEIFKDHWDEATFVEWTKSLVNQGAIASEEQYSTAHRPVNLDLNFLPFLQGMLYVGSEAPLSEEEIHLVQSLADAFSTAYARYEDFNKLEAAKKQVDSTLNELQATQKQLVQSEKMASLGELTAGIAHEIQNPLNFVNNFSDVNKELLIEMKDEMNKGNFDDAKAIADDVIENSEKINHHGKRAGDIVKGMLQHSRKSTGQKEPTDINALADEYLRLSYHGLRAKDKEFNANMQTDYDENIGKINIIPQDIGRVLLNLYNNAFYAVNEQKSQNLISYEPTVSVTTKKSDNHVIITVSDNGNGIPQNIVDKIFQPFFTTKPTGSGTGLGLSLSYDIVKAHGGEVKVESEESKGSEFIVQLPDV